MGMERVMSTQQRRKGAGVGAYIGPSPSPSSLSSAGGTSQVPCGTMEMEKRGCGRWCPARVLGPHSPGGDCTSSPHRPPHHRATCMQTCWTRGGVGGVCQASPYQLRVRNKQIRTHTGIWMPFVRPVRHSTYACITSTCMAAYGDATVGSFVIHCFRFSLFVDILCPTIFYLKKLNI
jgi:hypothetical protein